MTEKKRTTIALNEWEKNYLISVISGDWLEHKAILCHDCYYKKRGGRK